MANVHLPWNSTTVLTIWYSALQAFPPKQAAKFGVGDDDDDDDDDDVDFKVSTFSLVEADSSPALAEHSTYAQKKLSTLSTKIMNKSSALDALRAAQKQSLSSNGNLIVTSSMTSRWALCSDETVDWQDGPTKRLSQARHRPYKRVSTLDYTPFTEFPN